MEKTLNVGDAVRVRVHDGPGRPFTAVVDRVYANGDVAVLFSSAAGRARFGEKAVRYPATYVNAAS